MILKPLRTVLALAVGLAGCTGTARSSDVKSIPVAEAKPRIDQKQVFLLDVRTEHEWFNGRIPATDALIPVQELSARLQELAPYKDKPILVYCRSGNRSVTATLFLQQQGFSNVTDLKGGINAWKAAGYPVIEGPAKAPGRP